MLTQLHIQNIAVIKKASIPLKRGLNVFTGETGAGKTILISAIDSVLGERTSRDIIRTGEEKAQVTALFEDISPETKVLLEELGYESEDDSILVYREITTAGKNTCKINGMPANVSVLKAISSKLIHIHGQRDSAQLLAPERHMEMIDSYGELEQDIAKYREIYSKRNKIKLELNALNMDEEQKAKRLDMLQFQIEEIEKANLENESEEDELVAQRKLIQGSEKIRKALAEAYNVIVGGEETTGIQQGIDNLCSNVEQVATFVEEYTEMAQRLEQIRYEIEGYSSDIYSALGEYDFDPSQLDAIEYRLDTFYRLKQKYGNNISEIMAHYEEIIEEKEKIDSNDVSQEKLKKELAEVEGRCNSIALTLSKKRKKAAESLMRKIEEELTFLDMPSVKLSVAHGIVPIGSGGIDIMEFLIVTNVGEEPKPLSKIASGGEISRIMLAIKNVMADKDGIDSLIFDEVDTGVSGRAAGKIGKKLSEVSHTRQVIAVTHLAQVAAYADNHLLIAKESDSSHTYTQITALNHDEVVGELARITSGEVITEAALESARELWNRAHAEQ